MSRKSRKNKQTVQGNKQDCSKSKMENLSQQTGTTDASITNRIQEMEEKISGVENMVEEIDSSVEENVESKKNS